MRGAIQGLLRGDDRGMAFDTDRVFRAITESDHIESILTQQARDAAIYGND